MRNLSKIFQIKNQNVSAGFTLIELLVAIAITSIVVTISGFGLVAIMQNNTKVEAESLRRTELNRALDFIADEVRTAKNITQNASVNVSNTGTAPTGIAPSFNKSCNDPGSSSVKCVLILEIPGVSQRVIYYIKSAESTDPWLGPKVIYRWGPNINDNGQYTNATNPSNWQYEALVDLIINSTPNPNLNCPTDWSPNPTVANRQGFYACVDPTGKMTEIYLRGKLSNSVTPYQVNTRVFARSVTLP